MLTQLRNSSKGIIGGAIVFLGIIAFGAFGIQGLFYGSGQTVVAKVGSQEVSATEFARQFENALRLQTRQTGERPTIQQAKEIGLPTMVLEEMITNALFKETGERLGIATPDQAVLNALMEFDAFKGVDGEFDRQTYRNLLRENGMTVEIFENNLREDISRQQLVSAIAAGVQPPRGMVEAWLRYRGERREADFILLPPELAGDVPQADSETLDAFRKENAARYTAPETRAISYIMLRPRDVKDRVADEVSEEDVRAAYETNRARYETPEKRRVRQIVFPGREAAEVAASRIEAGETMTQIAEGMDLKESDIDTGLVLANEIIDPAVRDAVFALEEPGVAPVIEGQFGFVLAEVTEIEGGETKAFDEVRDELENELLLDKGGIEVEKISEQMVDILAEESQTLEQIAERFGLKAVSIEAIDAQGLDRDGNPVAAKPADETVMKLAFEGETGDPLELNTLSGRDGYFILRIDSVRPSALRPFEEIKDQLAQDWRDAEIAKALAERAAQLAEQGNAGTSAEALAKDAGTPLLSMPEPLRRGADDSGVLLAQTVDKVFNAPADAFVSGPAAENSYAVVRVKKVLPPDFSDPVTAAQIAGLRNQFARVYADSLIGQFIEATRRDLDVKIYDQAVEATLIRSR